MFLVSCTVAKRHVGYGRSSQLGLQPVNRKKIGVPEFPPPFQKRTQNLTSIAYGTQTGFLLSRKHIR